MITLAISNGTAVAATITDSGRSSYVLQAWNPGRIVRDNTFATSRWVDGGALTSTRDEIATMNMTVQVWGTAYADLLTKIDTLGSALGQFGYTITDTHTGGTTTYTCMPADYEVIYDPSTLLSSMAVVTASIPRQP